MKPLNLLALLLLLATILYGQKALEDKPRLLTFDENQRWLSTTKALDKDGQWTAIERRLICPDNVDERNDSAIYSPMIIVNGVPLLVPHRLSKKLSDEILSLLNSKTISEIAIVDKADEWTFHKPFAGVVLLTVDKKTSKRISKLKLR